VLIAMLEAGHGHREAGLILDRTLLACERRWQKIRTGEASGHGPSTIGRFDTL
jgi:hypothetical protein